MNIFSRSLVQLLKHFGSVGQDGTSKIHEFWVLILMFCFSN